LFSPVFWYQAKAIGRSELLRLRDLTVARTIESIIYGPSHASVLALQECSYAVRGELVSMLREHGWKESTPCAHHDDAVVLYDAKKLDLIGAELFPMGAMVFCIACFQRRTGPQSGEPIRVVAGKIKGALGDPRWTTAPFLNDFARFVRQRYWDAVGTQGSHTFFLGDFNFEQLDITAALTAAGVEGVGFVTSTNESEYPTNVNPDNFPEWYPINPGPLRPKRIDHILEAQVHSGCQMLLPDELLPGMVGVVKLLHWSGSLCAPPATLLEQAGPAVWGDDSNDAMSEASTQPED